MSGVAFRRYVAIGDSSTEGLEDPYPDGTYRGWADRLAGHVANQQHEPLEYANLAVRGLTVREIRDRQFDVALDLHPDLMSIFGGVNDMLGRHPDLEAIAADYELMFGTARQRGITVLTFTMVDPVAVNRLARPIRDRMAQLNRVIRETAERQGVLLVDFERYAVGADPRLWFEDRLHANRQGHALMAAALAARLGLDGFDDGWQQPLADQYTAPRGRTRVQSDLQWGRTYFAPWLIRGMLRVPRGAGVHPKRPVPAPVRGEHDEHGQEQRAN